MGLEWFMLKNEFHVLFLRNQIHLSAIRKDGLNNNETYA